VYPKPCRGFDDFVQLRADPFEEVAIDLDSKKLRLRVPRNEMSGDS